MLPTVPTELIFMQHPEIRRAALVGIGKNKTQATLVIERWDKQTKLKKIDAQIFYKTLKELAQTHSLSRHVGKFFLHKGFPVDTRHNIKIRREVLQQWCESHSHFEFRYE